MYLTIKRLKKETDEIVGRVNGKFATINWTPIWYYYRAMAFDDLIDLYMTSDIAMITPVRDGMNLVAKEFVATRVKGDGVLILSEMAGASKELYESILVNPFDLAPRSNGRCIVNCHSNARGRTEKKETSECKIDSNAGYSVEHWANEFMRALNTKHNTTEESSVIKINEKIKSSLVGKFKSSQK